VSNSGSPPTKQQLLESLLDQLLTSSSNEELLYDVQERLLGSSFDYTEAPGWDCHCIPYGNYSDSKSLRVIALELESEKNILTLQGKKYKLVPID
jgi:hypothetical protein